MSPSPRRSKRLGLALAAGALSGQGQFLQQTYRTELPATPYPTFLDPLYAYCYLVAVGLFVLFVWSSNQFEATPEDQQDRLRARINRIDGRCQWGALLGLGVWIALAWVF